MTDATILVPTHAHSALIPFALESALAQEGASFEVFVVGDGVGDDTREGLQPFLADPRVRFFDFPKGERHGERLRHQALEEASGGIVCYLSDDDLLLPGHVAAMLELLADADLAHAAPFQVRPDGTLQYSPIDLAQPQYQSMLVGKRWNAIVLTGAAHTLEAYRRLPSGWNPAPPDVWTDLHMWRQFVGLDGFRGRTGTEITMLHFADSERRGWSTEQRVAELRDWRERASEPGLREVLEHAALQDARAVGVRLELRVHELKDRLASIESTRTWRARTRAASLRPLRALLGRPPVAR